MKKCMGCMNDYEETRGICPTCGYSDAAAEEQMRKAPDLIAPETILAGRFIVGRALSLSGFSAVYLAWDALLLRRVVIRELFPYELCRRETDGLRLTPEPGAPKGLMTECVMKFEREVSLLSGSQDIPMVLNYYRSFKENGTIYAVTEYLEGSTLEDLYGGDRKAPASLCKKILSTVGAALDQLHARGIIHANLSPSSIYMCSNGELALIDFGMTKRWLSSRMRKDPGILDLRYSAPEILMRKVDLTVDMYSAGAVCWHLLTGKNPPDRLKKRIHIRDEGMGRLIDELTAAKPEDRPESFHAAGVYT